MLAKKCTEATVNFVRKHGKNILIEFAGVAAVTWAVSAICNKIDDEKYKLKAAGKAEGRDSLMDEFAVMGMSGYAEWKIPGKESSYVNLREAYDAYKESLKKK